MKNSTFQHRWVWTTIPNRFGFHWWQIALSSNWKRFWWGVPVAAGAAKTYRVGPFWFAAMRQTKPTKQTSVPKVVACADGEALGLIQYPNLNTPE